MHEMGGRYPCQCGLCKRRIVRVLSRRLQNYLSRSFHCKTDRTMPSSKSTVELNAKRRTLDARATTTFKMARCVPLRTIRSREERREKQPLFSAALVASTDSASPG